MVVHSGYLKSDCQNWNWNWDLKCYRGGSPLWLVLIHFLSVLLLFPEESWARTSLCLSAFSTVNCKNYTKCITSVLFQYTFSPVKFLLWFSPLLKRLGILGILNTLDTSSCKEVQCLHFLKVCIFTQHYPFITSENVYYFKYS